MSRRPLSWRVVAAGAAALAVLLPAAQARATGAATLASYAGRAESWGLDMRVVPVNQRETFPDLADEYYPHTMAAVDSLPHAVADGEFFDPGALVRVGPGEGNGVYLQPNGAPPILPKYPYIAQTTSDANSRRDVDAGTGQPFTPEPGVVPAATVPGAPQATGFGAGTAHAHADASPMGDSKGAVAGVNLGAVSVASITGESSAKQVGGVITATTTTTMKDITALGVIHIAGTTLTATLESAGPGTSKATGSVTYAGVTVAGTPATIDQDGLHVGGNDVSTAQVKSALQQLNAALAKANAQLVASQVITTPKSDATTETITNAVDGFGITFADPQNNLSVLISFGHAELSARTVLGAASGLAVPPPINLPPAPAPVSSGPALSDTVPPAATGGAVTHRLTQRRHRLALLPVGAQAHMLVLPFIAVPAELVMIGLLVQAWRMRRPPGLEEDLLAL
jgi:hypothetical protein